MVLPISNCYILSPIRVANAFGSPLCGSTLEMIEKLKPAIALLDRHQKPYDVVYTNFVGTIVYEDD